MVLVRHEIGDVLRDLRLQQGKTLRQVASRASVALGYLSEVERGQKEASSEILASVADALGTPISSIIREVGDRLAVVEGVGLSAPAIESIPDVFESMHIVESPVIPDTLPDELLAEFESQFGGGSELASR
ncbi:MAG TPA: helix-turn-helix transcriptional regulator [Microbacteriaceae bacterium]|nr:helix-turn-helix transcriptional regulator [Microbacteriaceae bacterium]